MALTMTEFSSCTISIPVRIKSKKTLYLGIQHLIIWYDLVRNGLSAVNSMEKKCTKTKMFHPGFSTVEHLSVCEDIVVQACLMLALTSISLCYVR